MDIGRVMVTESSEIRRAHQLLASSEEALERSRNRPQVRSSWLDDPQPSRTVDAPARKVRPDARAGRTMDATTQAKWDQWAKSIASNVAHAQCKVILESVGRVVGDALAQRDARIAELEQRLANLEKAITGEKVIEWPLRTGTGR